jgi:hypothetical protein
MKKIKVILALSVLVGGAVLASAKSSSTLVASTADITVTNVAPLVWIETMNAIPQSPFINTTNLSDASIIIVDNDSKGKIFGVVNVVQDFTQGTNNSIFAESSWIGNVSGSIKASKMGQPTVQMTIKANGYSSPTTNTLIVAKQSSSAGNASVNINFKSTSAAVPNSTNAFFGYTAAKVAGTSKISFKPGITAVQEKKNVTETATLDVWLYNEKELGLRVVSFGSKFGVIMQDLFGTGSVNSKNQFTVNLKNGGGDSLQLKGQVAAAVIVNGDGTNNIVTISQMDEKGKVSGQAVEGKGFFSKFGGFVE